MAIISSELILYGSANRPEDDTTTVGGAIDATARPFDANLAANDDIEILSSEAGDVRTVTIRYRNAAGVEASVGPTALNGTTPVAMGITAERLLEVIVSATHGTRSVTIRRASDDALLHTVNPGETRAFRMFNKAVSTTSQKIYYEKIFWKNTHGTLSLLNAIVDLTADPLAKVEIGAAPTVGDTATATNRLTAPGSVSFVNDNVNINVPGTNLAAGAAIGVWVKLTLDANESALKNSFTTRLRGESV
jgi:hypothetical protein